jgi:acetoin:2,6-dichlorophenolindophenol oxidoreductase subunit alpha
MRTATTGIRPDIPAALPLEQSLEMFKRICNSRYFDLEVVRAVESKRLNYPVYLSLGQEAVSAALSFKMSGAMLFTQHRCHAYYLAFGGTPEKLRDELLGRPEGSSGGRAGSNCLQSHTETLTMFGHHGLIGENVPQAVGAAFGSGRQTLCVFGDGAAEEDYIYPSLGFAVTHKLPVLFVCEDNDLSILTPTSARRSWKIKNLAESFGMPAFDVTDDPWTVADIAGEIRGYLPAFVNVHVCRKNWHVGVGTDGPTEWNRFELVKQKIALLGGADRAAEIEIEQRRAMEQIWTS